MDVFSWVAFLIPLGVGVMSLREYRFAKVCFAISALVLAGRFSMWDFRTNQAFSVRAPITVLVIGLVGLLLIESVRWVDRKKMQDTTIGPNSPMAQPPDNKSPKGTPDEEAPPTKPIPNAHTSRDTQVVRSGPPDSIPQPPKGAVNAQPVSQPELKQTVSGSGPSAENEGFHEKIGTYFVNLGENGFSTSVFAESLRAGNQPFTGVPITFFLKGNDDKIHYRIAIWSGFKQVEVTDNEFVLNQPFWDRNFDKSALEIVDENQNPILQVIWKTPSHLVVNGIFKTQDGSISIADTKGFRPFKLGDKIKPLFKYPSRRFQGEPADQ
jgi:hypothetical protein